MFKDKKINEDREKQVSGTLSDGGLTMPGSSRACDGEAEGFFRWLKKRLMLLLLVRA